MRLSEFSTEKGIEVAAQAFPLIMIMRENPETVKAWGKVLDGIREDKEKAKEAAEKAKKAHKKVNAEDTAQTKNTSKRLYEYYSAMILNEREAALELFALLNDVDVEEYRQYNAAALLADMINAFAYDADLMNLFIPQRPKKRVPSSGSATENTEGAEK